MHVLYNQGSSHKYIKADKNYLVYAIWFGKKLEYCIQLDDFPSSPSFYDATLFSVVDSRISHYWKIPNNGETPATITFSDWAEDSSFYQNLVESTGRAGEIWRSYRSKMQLEFAPHDLQISSVSLPENWQMCSLCDEAWRPENYGEVIVCPKCSTAQRRASGFPE